MQPGSSVQKQVERVGESIHRTGFSREEAGTFAAVASSDLPPSRLKPVLQFWVLAALPCAIPAPDLITHGPRDASRPF